MNKVRFNVQTLAEPELDPPEPDEPEPMVRFKVQGFLRTGPEVRFRVQQNY
jgi:hypothetical protein